MNRYGRAGLWAGFLTVVATTALLLAGGMLGLLPAGLDVRGMAVIVDPAQRPLLALALGAANHIVAGCAVGLLYGWFAPRFSPWTGIGALMISWFALMLIGLPLTGRGLFGLAEGASLPIATLALHILFGAAMGALARAKLAVLEARSRVLR